MVLVQCWPRLVLCWDIGWLYPDTGSVLVAALSSGAMPSLRHLCVNREDMPEHSALLTAACEARGVRLSLDGWDWESDFSGSFIWRGEWPMS